MSVAASKLTPEQEEILTLRDRVFDLEEENADLKRILSGSDELVQYPPEWRLTRVESIILASLMSAPEGRRTREAILARLYPHHEQDGSPNILSVFMTRIRTKLEPFGVQIATRRGYGYELSAADRAIISTKIDKWKSGETETVSSRNQSEPLKLKAKSQEQ